MTANHVGTLFAERGPADAGKGFGLGFDVVLDVGQERQLRQRGRLRLGRRLPHQLLGRPAREAGGGHHDAAPAGGRLGPARPLPDARLPVDRRPALGRPRRDALSRPRTGADGAPSLTTPRRWVDFSIRSVAPFSRRTGGRVESSQHPSPWRAASCVAALISAFRTDRRRRAGGGRRTRASSTVPSTTRAPAGDSARTSRPPRPISTSTRPASTPTPSRRAGPGAHDAARHGDQGQAHRRHARGRQGDPGRRSREPQRDLRARLQHPKERAARVAARLHERRRPRSSSRPRASRSSSPARRSPASRTSTRARRSPG